MTHVQPVVSAQPILTIEGLSKTFTSDAGLSVGGRKQIPALLDIDMSIFRGEILGLVGESGCGKTTLGRCIVGIHPPTTGQVILHSDAGDAVDITNLPRSQRKAVARDVRMIFQDPFGSLNPRMTVEDIVAEPLRVHRLEPESRIEARVCEMLDRCGIRPELRRRYPHAFSGGQRQRIGIARALVTRPRLVVADEAVSALDVSVRAQILNLLADLRDEMDLTILFIGHDLGVVRKFCDRVAVMYSGRIVELATSAELFRRPRHPYTEALLSAIPIPDPQRRGTRERIILTGDVPDPAARPAGCAFHPRCRHTIEDCARAVPVLQRIPNEERKVSCLRSTEILQETTI